MRVSTLCAVALLYINLPAACAQDKDAVDKDAVIAALQKENAELKKAVAELQKQLAELKAKLPPVADGTKINRENYAKIRNGMHLTERSTVLIEKGAAKLPAEVDRKLNVVTLASVTEILGEGKEVSRSVIGRDEYCTTVWRSKGCTVTIHFRTMGYGAIPPNAFARGLCVESKSIED
jgi:glucose/arabinose dehydrogenase